MTAYLYLCMYYAVSCHKVTVTINYYKFDQLCVVLFLDSVLGRLSISQID